MAERIDRKRARPTTYGPKDRLLGAYPPVEQWDSWSEFDPAAWPRKVPRE
ncbi:MAG: hypothetical protein WBP81_06810 [Solirubrobacteraceae bacterium]